MVKIDFLLFICYYLGISLLLFLGIWLSEKKEEGLVRLKYGEQVWQCAICLYVYFVSKTSQISACPQCGSLNHRQKGLNGGGK